MACMQRCPCRAYDRDDRAAEQHSRAAHHPSAACRLADLQACRLAGLQDAQIRKITVYHIYENRYSYQVQDHPCVTDDDI